MESPSSSNNFLGFQRIYNISTSSPVQTYYWIELPPGQFPKSDLLAVPLQNGTVEVLNITSMAVVQKFNVGTGTIGFIGVSYSPDQKYVVVADGPSGVVQLRYATNMSLIWQDKFLTASNATAYPCDVRFSPDSQYIAIPMKNNNTVVVINTLTGKAVSMIITGKNTNPYMLTISPSGDMVVVEFVGNKTDVFYTFPSLHFVAAVTFGAAGSHFTPQRGAFTPDGSYYLEASASTNQIAVVSTKNYTVINVINLPATSAPGLADIELTPDMQNFYVVEHGNVNTGGVVYIIPVSQITSSSPQMTELALSTAPSVALPISTSFGNFLADNVLQPPVQGLHC